MEDGQGTADEFLDLANWVNVNKAGTIGDMAWAAMLQEEVQYQLNDADKSEIIEIDILLRYLKSSNRTLMVKLTGLYGIFHDAIKPEYVHIDYPDTLVIYIIRSIIGVKSSRKPQFSVEANRWISWAEKFINSKTRRIARLVTILGIDSLEEVFEYQVTLAILWQLMFQQLCLEILKKNSGNDRQHTNEGKIWYKSPK